MDLVKGFFAHLKAIAAEPEFKVMDLDTFAEELFNRCVDAVEEDILYTLPRNVDVTTYGICDTNKVFWLVDAEISDVQLSGRGEFNSSDNESTLSYATRILMSMKVTERT
jgi:hypothetical protein